MQIADELLKQREDEGEPAVVAEQDMVASSIAAAESASRGWRSRIKPDGGSPADDSDAAQADDEALMASIPFKE